MRNQTGTPTRQMVFAALDEEPSTTATRPVETASPHGPQLCAICQSRQVMVVAGGGGGRSDLFHTLCFRCYHLQMQRKRMIRRRRAQAAVRGANADLADGLRQRSVPRAPKYQAMDHRRRQAQMAARREMSWEMRKMSGGVTKTEKPEPSDPIRVGRLARAAALAGRAG